MVGVLDILGGEYKYAILFFLRMDSCLGLHDLKKTCVVKCSLFRAIVMHSCPVLKSLLLGCWEVTFVFRGTCCLFFFFVVVVVCFFFFPFGDTRN